MREQRIQPEGKLWGKLKPVAREMRHMPTEAENVLWQRLRNRQVAGFRFRRQHAIDRFIVDFYCREANLVIEVDGEIHQQQVAEDQERDAFLTMLGFTVLRFTNEQVLLDLENVIHVISKHLSSKS